MKPIIAIASMLLGASTMATVVYMENNSDAFVSRTRRLSRSPDQPGPLKLEKKVEVLATFEASPIQLDPIRITGRPTNRKATILSKPTAADNLTACSNWRTLGPAASKKDGASGEHQVKLLCPTGATAAQTF